MTFLDGKHRFAGSHTEVDILMIGWEGEIFGVGLLESLAEQFPEHKDVFTAGAYMEWINVRDQEPFGHSAGRHVSVEKAEKLAREGGRSSGITSIRSRPCTS